MPARQGQARLRRSRFSTDVSLGSSGPPSPLHGVGGAGMGALTGIRPATTHHIDSVGYLKYAGRPKECSLPDEAPGGHAALSRDVGRLDGIGQASAEPAGKAEQHRLVDKEPIAAVRQAHLTPGRTDDLFEP